jgi:hypothetical protein
MPRPFQFSLKRLGAAVAWVAMAMFIATFLTRDATPWLVIQIPAMVACCTAALTCLTRGIGTSFLVAAGIIVGSLALFAIGAVFR